MLTESGFVFVPTEARRFLGDPVPGSRLYRRDGPEDELEYWFEAVMSVAGDVVSPGGAQMYAPVSRAAVHKRIKEGKLTAFFFYPTTEKRSFFGKPKSKRESPYGYICCDELKVWGEELKERAIREGQVTREDLEGAKPDWLGDFYEWDSRWQRQQERRSRDEGQR